MQISKAYRCMWRINAPYFANQPIMMRIQNKRKMLLNKKPNCQDNVVYTYSFLWYFTIVLFLFKIQKIKKYIYFADFFFFPEKYNHIFTKFYLWYIRNSFKLYHIINNNLKQDNLFTFWTIFVAVVCHNIDNYTVHFFNHFNLKERKNKEHFYYGIKLLHSVLKAVRFYVELIQFLSVILSL